MLTLEEHNAKQGLPTPQFAPVGVACNSCAVEMLRSDNIVLHRIDGRRSVRVRCPKCKLGGDLILPEE